MCVFFFLVRLHCGFKCLLNILFLDLPLTTETAAQSLSLGGYVWGRRFHSWLSAPVPHQLKFPSSIHCSKMINIGFWLLLIFSFGYSNQNSKHTGRLQGALHCENWLTSCRLNMLMISNCIGQSFSMLLPWRNPWNNFQVSENPC